MLNINYLYSDCLPNTIEVDGRQYKLCTNYRLWLSFGEAIGASEQTSDMIKIKGESVYPLLCENITPPPLNEETISELFNFYACTDKYPISSDNTEKTISFRDDMGYIYADFLRQYHIDLLSVEMHWHVFISLFRGLFTSMTDIVSCRSYSGTDAEAQRQKSQWRIQDDETRPSYAAELEDALRNGGNSGEILRRNGVIK